jgi:hypothetical protein
MTQKALIKLDNTKKTGSTGGVVVEVVKIHPEYSFFKEHKYFPEYQNDKNYQIITVKDDVKPGWILTSKTNMIVDSNEPPK